MVTIQIMEEQDSWGDFDNPLSTDQLDCYELLKEDELLMYVPLNKIRNSVDNPIQI